MVIIASEPVQRTASVVAATQKLESKAFEVLLDRLFLLKMSMTHIRVTKQFATWVGRDVHRTDLIWFGNRKIPQKVRVDFVP